MSEDSVLKEIHKIITNDDLPIDKVLRRVIELAQNYLDREPNLLSLLLSMGITHASQHQIHEKRVGIYPYTMFSLYAKYSRTGWKCYLISPHHILDIKGFDVQKFISGINEDVSIRHGMLTLIERNETCLIIPRHDLITFNHGKLCISTPHNMEIELPLSVDDLDQDIHNWIYM